MKFLFENSSLIAQSQLQNTARGLSEYINHLNTVREKNNYSFSESSINLPFDTSILEQAEKVKKDKINSNLKYILDIGIGGSNLGTKAIYDAMLGYKDILESNYFPKIIFVDTCDPEFLRKVQLFLKSVNPEEILINVISKSGTTTETIFNLEVVYQALESNQEIKDRIVATTDKGSKLWNLAQEKGIATLEIPELVGGRFSVFSAVGIFPLLAAGVDVEKVLQGAQEILQECLDQDVLRNPAALSALILYLHYQDGKNINDNFFFHPELESAGKWYRQLMGESIGKGQDLDGKKVASGITPTVSIGSIDLHSMGQLYLGGPNDKITTFVYSERSQDIEIAQSGEFSSLVQGIEGKTAKKIMSAIFEGVKIAYEKKQLPFMELILNEIDEKSLGEFLQFKMVEMMFLGKLLNVNTFDQPNVEDYKIETKRILNS